MPNDDDALSYNDYAMPNDDDALSYNHDTMPHDDDALSHYHDTMPYNDNAVPNHDDAMPYDDHAVPHDCSEPLRHDREIHGQVRLEDGQRCRRRWGGRAAPTRWGTAGPLRVGRHLVPRCPGRLRVPSCPHQGGEEHCVVPAARPRSIDGGHGVSELADSTARRACAYRTVARERCIICLGL